MKEKPSLTVRTRKKVMSRDVNKLDKLNLTELGVRLMDEYGEMRELKEILKDVESAYGRIKSSNEIHEKKVIGGGRRRGKTTELIQYAYAHGLLIVCPTEVQARLVFEQSKEMGLEIKMPISIQNLKHYYRREKIVIDEIESVMRQLTGCDVVMMSTSYQLGEMEELNKERF